MGLACTSRGLAACPLCQERERWVLDQSRELTSDRPGEQPKWWCRVSCPTSRARPG